jgi:cellulose synthase/poly-beta-1,6-N-acetylglucosamine synthase-like glycosyltransferase
MRLGLSPAKSEGQLPPYGRHRVIVPIYIPHREGYFKDALEILRLCLESLTRTTTDKATITLISNGCMAEAIEMMQEYFRDGKVDQLIIHRQNRGKVDAVVSAMRGCFEELLTVSDCDVLFRPGWLEAVEQVFEHFPEAGVVSPVPSPSGIWLHTSATLPEAWLRGQIAFEKIVPESDLDRFSKSIGRPDLFGPQHKAIQTLVVRNGFKACVGCGHFVATFRRSAMTTMPLQP